MPAAPEKRTNRRNMLIPKTGDRTRDFPRLFDFSVVICPPERRALREIVETAEVVRQNGHVYLLARVAGWRDATSTVKHCLVLPGRLRATWAAGCGVICEPMRAHACPRPNTVPYPRPRHLPLRQECQEINGL